MRRNNNKKSPRQSSLGWPRVFLFHYCWEINIWEKSWDEEGCRAAPIITINVIRWLGSSDLVLAEERAIIIVWKNL